MCMPIAWRSFALCLTVSFVLVSVGSSGAAEEELPSQNTPEAVGSLRPRPTPRPFDNPAAVPTEDDGVPAGRPAPVPTTDARTRSDDPVLRWLPEILAAATTTGTPPSLIAGVMRVESGGDPESISVDGAQGLMQVMPAELTALGIPRTRWRDPGTNVLAGATILAQRSGGGWEAAVAYYFGIGCDAYDTCTYEYVVAVLAWTTSYASVLGDPIALSAGNIPPVPSRATSPDRQTGRQDAVRSTAPPDQSTSGTDPGWGVEGEAESPAPAVSEQPAEPAAEAPEPDATADTGAWAEGG